ncbi:MAG: cytochrome c [Crocinitomicaceae bacterium]
MKTKRIKYFGWIAFIAVSMMSSCKSDPNSPGMEYMPDMYRSSAVEAYVDYGEVEGKYDEEAVALVEEKFNYLPPNGTIPYSDNEKRAAVNMPYKHGAPLNSDKTHGLYGMKQDSTGYEDAANDINPIPFSEEVLKEGEVLFGRFCIHCHGEKGAGDGAVPNTGKYPPPPAYSGPLKDLPAGKIFYSITYGKNAMGSHASQVSKEERWKLVYYVQKLQGKELGGEAEDTETISPESEVEAETGHNE